VREIFTLKRRKILADCFKIKIGSKALPILLTDCFYAYFAHKALIGRAIMPGARGMIALPV